MGNGAFIIINHSADSICESHTLGTTSAHT